MSLTSGPSGVVPPPPTREPLNPYPVRSQTGSTIDYRQKQSRPDCVRTGLLRGDDYCRFLVLSTLFPNTPPRIPPATAPITAPFSLSLLVTAPIAAPAAAPIAASRFVCFSIR